jgi:hypothetical protein
VRKATEALAKHEGALTFGGLTTLSNDADEAQQANPNTLLSEQFRKPTP